MQGTAPGSPHRSSEQGVPAGTQMPPQFSQQSLPVSHRMAAQFEVCSIGSQVPPHSAQQVVPSGQRTAAQGLATGWQKPPQSAPPAAGSQSSFGSSTHS